MISSALLVASELALNLLTIFQMAGNRRSLCLAREAPRLCPIAHEKLQSGCVGAIGCMLEDGLLLSCT